MQEQQEKIPTVSAGPTTRGRQREADRERPTARGRQREADSERPTASGRQREADSGEPAQYGPLAHATALGLPAALRDVGPARVRRGGEGWVVVVGGIVKIIVVPALLIGKFKARGPWGSFFQATSIFSTNLMQPVLQFSENVCKVMKSTF